jgi:hypothetical protein
MEEQPIKNSVGGSVGGNFIGRDAKGDVLRNENLITLASAK